MVYLQTRCFPILFLFPLTLLIGSTAQGQDQSELPSPAEEIVVRLDSLTLSDDTGLHIEGFKDTPDEALILPEIDEIEHAFLSVFLSHDIEDDNTISILVLPDSSGERLYIDFNNDEDLTNDGPPVWFDKDDPDLVFWLTVPGDSLQKTGRILQRVPRSVRQNPERQDWFDGITDEEGNLKPLFKNLFSIEGGPGEYYFDDRISLRRGTVVLKGKEVHLGLYERSANGLFNEEKDVLIVDLDGDKKLQVREDSTVFKLNEVFEINGTSYRLTYVDRYGRGLRMVEVDELPDQLYLVEKKAVFASQDLPVRTEGSLDSTFWQLSLPTTGGDTLRMVDYRGKFVLLNIWGEWCGPCLVEMPELVEAYEQFPRDRFETIGVLQTGDVEAAESMLRRYGAPWHQVMLGEPFRNVFEIRGFPTNILIFPDGKKYLEAGMINARFIKKYVE